MNYRQETRTLRRLIREFDVRYNLPTTGRDASASGGKKVEPLDVAKSIVLALLVGKASVFAYDNKDDIISFAKNVKDFLANIFTESVVDVSDKSGLRNVIREMILEADKGSLDTIYGPIESKEVIDLITSNSDSIKTQQYISFPKFDMQSFKTGNDLTTRLVPVVGNVRDKLEKIYSIVSSTNKEDFPGVINRSFSATLQDVDNLKDLDANERSRANKAMADMCATAIYNDIKTRLYNYIADVSENIKKIQDEKIRKECEDALKKFTEEIADLYDSKITGTPRQILTGRT